MTPSKLRELVDGALARGQIPAQPMLDVSARVGAAEDYGAIVVDLAKVLAKAVAAKARSIDIYADTLVIPGGAELRVADPLLRVTVIARRIVVGGSATILLDHRAPLVALRIVAGAIEGELKIASEQDGKRQEYSLDAIFEPREAPAFTNFVWHESAPAVRQTVVPVGLLARGAPLHAHLSATFSLVAGAVAVNDEQAEILALAHAMLRWIAGWSGLQSDLAQISRLAESLRGILPRFDQDGLVLPIPPLTPEIYLSMAEALKEQAKAIALDARFLELKADTTEVAKQFTASFLRRDDAEIRRIENAIKTQQADIVAIEEAIARAARAVQDRQFDRQIDEIDLKEAQAHDTIDKIVQAAFDITIGLITLGASIASICLGVPSDPSASAKKDIQGVQGLIDAIKGAKATPLLGKADVITHLRTLGNLFKLPFKFGWATASDNKDNYKALAASGKQIASAVGTILNHGAAQANFNHISEQIGSAMRALADSPSPLEARAAWDVLEVEATNALDVAIAKTDAAGVAKAANKLKTTIQKIAIFGRLLAEQQARKDAADRALGALGLQHLALGEMRASYETLAGELSDRETLNARIRSEIEIRQQEVARAFFLACYGVRRALYYDLYTIPDTLPEIAGDAAALERLFIGFKGALASATVKRSRLEDRRREILIDTPEMLADFAAGKSVRVLLDADDSNFERLSRIRLTELEVRVLTDKPLAGMIGVELSSGTKFRDRSGKERPRFSGEAWRFTSEVRDGADAGHWSGKDGAVLPTPFSEFLVTLYDPAPALGASATGLRLLLNCRVQT